MITDLDARGVGFRSLTESVDTTTAAEVLGVGRATVYRHLEPGTATVQA